MTITSTRTLAVLALAYVVANVVGISFVPLLHELDIALVVERSATNEPMVGAKVELLMPSGDGFVESGASLITDAEGRVLIERTVQRQPHWMFPLVGTHRWDEVLRVTSTKGNSVMRRLVDVHEAPPLSVERVDVRLTVD